MSSLAAKAASFLGLLCGIPLVGVRTRSCARILQMVATDDRCADARSNASILLSLDLWLPTPAAGLGSLGADLDSIDEAIRT
jgi:hypothetical protein